MTIRLIDYAWTHPADLSGYDGVLRYISHDDGKDITPDEARAHITAGRSITLVFETTATRALDGFQAGVDDAHYCNTRIANRCPGYAGDIYVAVDTDALPSAVVAYFQGWHRTSDHVVSVYGGGDVCRYLKHAGLARHGWQSVSNGWRGSSPLGAGIDLHQIGEGADHDDNVALVADWGQWKGDDLTPQEAKMLKDVHDRLDEIDAVRSEVHQMFTNHWSQVNAKLDEILAKVSK